MSMDLLFTILAIAVMLACVINLSTFLVADSTQAEAQREIPLSAGGFGVATLLLAWQVIPGLHTYNLAYPFLLLVVVAALSIALGHFVLRYRRKLAQAPMLADNR